MLSYGIGLDIGIASVGWAVVALDNNELPYGIINMGSRIFDAAENPKDGASLALPRREARSMRCAVTGTGTSVYAPCSSGAVF
mgnify:CR=1 FL=1